MSIFNDHSKFIFAACAGSTCVMAMCLALPASAADGIEFNSLLLNNGGGAPVELKYFEQGNSVPPGTYGVDIYLNGNLIRRQDIEFIPQGEKAEVRPVLQLGLLTGLGVDVPRLLRENILPQGLDEYSPVDVAALIQGASVEFDVNNLALLISIPQAYVQRNARGYVDPSLWDDGITTLFTDYQANFNRNVNQGDRRDYRYLGLRTGFNLLGWRLRNDSAMTGGTNMDSRWRSNRTFVERDIRALKGTMAAGELFSRGDIFDSVRMRGVQLNSDLGMHPDNEVGYAPVVRGIAETNATVEVRQNGYVIYSTSVTPGAFEITDVYPSGSNGDLEILIIEADGRERRFTQSFSYLPVMTRRGSLRYNVAAGKVDNDGQPSPNLVQATAVYGVSDNLTGFGGLLSAEKYHAVNIGAGFNTPVGGVSVDVTNSQSDTSREGRNSGQSVRFLYSKTLARTDTTFTMVGYRYSTEGYRTLNQHVADLQSLGAFTGRQKSSFDMTVNQTMAGRGSLYLGLGETNYWNRQGNTRRWQLGYSNSFRDLSYSLAMSKTRESGPGAQTDTQFTASISMPLGRTSHRAYASAVTSERGSSSVQAGVSGYLDERNTLNYSVQGNHNEEGGASGSLGLGWDTPTSRLNANYSQGRDSKTMSLSTAGSVVLHSGGMTLGPPVGETFALIEVPDARGVGVDSYAAVRTDRNGFAVVPFVQPYRYNWVNLNTSTLGNDIEIEENSQMVVPTRGSVVKTTFAAVTGRRLQFELSLDNGKRIPFGAQAFDESGKSLGLVDNLSRLLVFGVADEGRLEVRWEGNSCAVNYNLPPVNKELSYERYQAMCRSL